jgi:hypothetical protein
MEKEQEREEDKIKEPKKEKKRKEYLSFLQRIQTEPIETWRVS